MKRNTPKRSLGAIAASVALAGTIALVPSGGASASTTPTSTTTSVTTPLPTTTPTGTGPTTDGYGDGV